MLAKVSVTVTDLPASAGVTAYDGPVPTGTPATDQANVDVPGTGQASVNRSADGKIKLTGAVTLDRADVSAQSKTPVGVVAMDVICSAIRSATCTALSFLVWAAARNEPVSRLAERFEEAP